MFFPKKTMDQMVKEEKRAQNLALE